MQNKIVEARIAVNLIQDGKTIAVGGAGAGHNVPDLLLQSLGERYKETQSPNNLTIIHPCGIGDNDTRGINHIAQEGLVKRNIGGFWGNAPKMAKLALESKIEGYNFPQGVLSQLLRTSAGGESGLLTKTGLHTFVDPRYEGGKVNATTRDNLVEFINVFGNEALFFKSLPIDVAFIRGTSVDKEGNLTMEDEVGTFMMLSMAQAARTNGGIVIAQVKNVNQHNYSKPERVKVPGALIDYIVQDPHQTMTFVTDREEAFISRDAVYSEDSLTLAGIKKIVSRRAAVEIKKGEFVNLGYGMPDGVPIVAKQENILDKITFLIEQGPIGGVISTGLNFGAMYNPSAIVDDAYQFDFFHGGGLNICFLGFAQIDEQGNVNSSRFGNIFTGCGGFIDISQNTKRVVFCGGFAAKSEVEISDKKLKIKYKGKYKKFIKKVEQITFNGQYAIQKGQQVLYCTERAVFELKENGIELIEVAPGVDIEKDILNMMGFTPIISKKIKIMDQRIFSNLSLNLSNTIFK